MHELGFLSSYYIENKKLENLYEEGAPRSSSGPVCDLSNSARGGLFPPYAFVIHQQQQLDHEIFFFEYLC